MYAEAPFISRRLVARADGFLSKRCAPAEPGGAIKAVRRGEARYSGGAGFNHGQSPLERLSKREFEVCRGLARGDSMRAIAARLNISPKTGCASRQYLRKAEGALAGRADPAGPALWHRVMPDAAEARSGV